MRKRKGSLVLRDLVRGGDKEKKRMKEDGRERDRGMWMASEKKGSGGKGSGVHEEQDEGEREIQELLDTIVGVTLRLLLISMAQGLSISGMEVTNTSFDHEFASELLSCAVQVSSFLCPLVF